MILKYHLEGIERIMREKERERERERATVQFL